MKKFNIALLGVLASIIFFYNARDTKAQCPPGWTAVTVTMTINNCPYKLDLCAYCSMLGNIHETQIRSITQIITSPPCIQTWDFQQVLNYVNSQIQTMTFFSLYLCPNFNYPPCVPPSGVTARTYNEPICWHVKKVIYFGEEHHVYAMCDGSAYCKTVKEYCVEPNGTVRETVVSGPTLENGPIGCTQKGSEITVPSSFDVWSDCYIFHTACNP